MRAARKVILGGAGGQAVPSLLTSTSVSAASGTAGGTVTTPPINTTGASLLFVTIASFQTSFPAIIDSAGNTWTPLSQHAGMNQAGIQSFIAEPPLTSNAHTFSCTYPGLAYATVTVLAIEGTSGGAMDDQGTNVAAGTNTCTPGVATTAGKLLYITSISHASVTLPTVDSGFTVQRNVAFVNGESLGLATATLIGQQSGTVLPTWACNSGTSYSGNLVTFA